MEGRIIELADWAGGYNKHKHWRIPIPISKKQKQGCEKSVEMRRGHHGWVSGKKFTGTNVYFLRVSGKKFTGTDTIKIFISLPGKISNS